MSINTTGQGTILPPGTAPVLEKPPGDLTVVIKAVTPENPEGCLPAMLKDENGKDTDVPAPVSTKLLVDCLYPNGQVKTHQVDDLTDLAGKVARNVKALYGLGDVPFKSVPKELTEGGIFEIGA